MSALDEAREHAARRAAAQPRIDYARMQREFPKQKAALTRARKTGDADKVVKTCQETIKVWNEIGAWPDDWSHWQRALDDVLGWNRTVQLDDLPLI